MKFEEDHRFLRNVIYAGLKDLNTGFDSPLISHFSALDFLEVIDRCERLGVKIIGIESFCPEDELLAVQIGQEPGFDWARSFVRESGADVTFSATYDLGETRR